MKSDAASAVNRPWLRILLAATLLVAGVIWSVMFPKKASFDPDMVASVCIGVGLIGSGLLVAFATRMRWTTRLLALALLWSLLANAWLWSEVASRVELLRKLSPTTTAQRR